MPLPANISNRTARQKYITRLLPLMIAQTDDVDPAYLVAVALCPESPPGAAILRALDAELEAPGQETRAPVVFRWAPHDWLADVLQNMRLGTEAQREALSRREPTGAAARAAWVLDDGRVEIVSVPLDDQARSIMIEARRERVQRENLREAGIEIADVPERPGVFAVGSALDPNQYLPEPFPEDWQRESDPSLAGQEVLVAARVRASIRVLTMESHRRVFALVRCVTEDRPPRDEEIATVTSRLRNVGDFSEVPLADASGLVVPPDWRVLAAPTLLAPDPPRSAGE